MHGENDETFRKVDHLHCGGGGGHDVVAAAVAATVDAVNAAAIVDAVIVVDRTILQCNLMSLPNGQTCPIHLLPALASGDKVVHLGHGVDIGVAVIAVAVA